MTYEYKVVRINSSLNFLIFNYLPLSPFEQICLMFTLGEQVSSTALQESISPSELSITIISCYWGGTVAWQGGVRKKN